MSGRFDVLVRFDVRAREVGLTVEGAVEPEAVDEVCEVIERSVSISGSHASVDLSGSEVEADTVDQIRDRCGDIADITGPDPGPGPRR